MSGFNITAICNIGITAIQKKCPEGASTVRTDITPLEITAFAIASTLVLWQIAYQANMCRLQGFARKNYIEMPKVDSNEKLEQAQQSPQDQQVPVPLFQRIDSFVITLALFYVIVQNAIGFDLVRRAASDETCTSMTEFAHDICDGILNATYHSVIP